MESKQRKLLNNLLISGTALIAVALLDALQLIIYFVVDPIQRYLLELIFESSNVLGWTLVGLIAGWTLIEIVFCCVVGFSARAEAKRKKRNIFYVIVAIIMAVLLFAICIYTLIQLFSHEITVYSVFDSLTSVALSAVVIYVLIDIIICSLKNRKIAKESQKINIEDTNKNEEVTA